MWALLSGYLLQRERNVWMQGPGRNSTVRVAQINVAEPKSRKTENQTSSRCRVGAVAVMADAQTEPTQTPQFTAC